MKLKAACLLLGLISISSLAYADLIISSPYVSQQKATKVEVGASPELLIQYKNTTLKPIVVSEAELFLSYDPTVIDTIVTLVDPDPEKARITESNLLTAGQVSCKIAIPALTLQAGDTIDLAVLVFHVNQDTTAKRSVSLFNWQTNAPSVVRDQDKKEITGTLSRPSTIYLEPSQPPEFSGLNQVMSANSLGIKNPGNTLVLDWRTAAGAFDQTKYYRGQLSYRVWRRDQQGSWLELSPAPATADPYTDPIDRAPYTGNFGSDYLFEDTKLNDGQTYVYQVTARDDCSPQPNEKSNTALLSGTPFDQNPPGEIKLQPAEIADRSVVLRWQNPPDTDLAGVVVIRSLVGPVSEQSLGLANPQTDGPQYLVGDQPFGAGKGEIVAISGPAVTTYTDLSLNNSEPVYYRLCTFDRPQTTSPIKRGYNYSSGVKLKAVPGIVPRAVTDFQAELGEYPDEILITWNNSPDRHAAGTLVRYSTDDTLRYNAFINPAYGQLMADFPTYGQPGELDGYYIGGLETGKTYYLKAYSHNALATELIPNDPKSLSRHLFSDGVVSSVYLPKQDAASSPGTIRQTAGREPDPQLQIWFDKRLYHPSLAAKGIEFYVTSTPLIKVRATIPAPYNLDKVPSSYLLVLDDSSTLAYRNKQIGDNEANFDLQPTRSLAPGKHTLTFSARSSGQVSQVADVSQKVVFTVTSGRIEIIDQPISFPNPFNPDKDNQMTLQYTLGGSAQTGIDIYIFNINGKMIKKIMIPAGEDGTLGQLNKVSWDGRTDQGIPTASGQYLANIVSRDSKQVMAKLKFTIFR